VQYTLATQNAITIIIAVVTLMHAATVRTTRPSFTLTTIPYININDTTEAAILTTTRGGIIDSTTMLRIFTTWIHNYC
jgi:hypothetical protein